MKTLIFQLFVLLLANGYAQEYSIGFRTLKLKDSSRVYKPGTTIGDPMHFRPVDLDIWYPSEDKNGRALKFGDLFRLLEERAMNYQEEEDYSGMTEQLAQFYVAELGVGADSGKLLDITTQTQADLAPLNASSRNSEMPLIIYMAGFNGMGFENYPILEQLAAKGYVVVSIWSVGRYPGNMTNQKEDMMEQVLDAEFALQHLKKSNLFKFDSNRIGVLGCSWGGMSAAALIKRNPSIQAFVSLDGTETHYFGEEDENDQFIQDIHDAHLIAPEDQSASYLYFESGDKLDEFTPEKVYSYFDLLNSEKYYMRFMNSAHADFSCIPYILESSPESKQVYEDLQAATLAFFDHNLKNQDTFSDTWKQVSNKSYSTIVPFKLSTKTEVKTSITGTIVDKETGEPLPYVNIGILNRERGTVSNQDGRFNLEFTEENEGDTIRISSIGYRAQDIRIQDLNNSEQISIRLEEQPGELNEIVIPVKGLRSKTLGNKTQSKFMSTGFSYDQLGAEMGVRINIRRSPTYVDAFHSFITYNRLSSRSVFRVNFYSVKKGKPDRNLLKSNILVGIDPKQTGVISVDLKPYDIVLHEDVIVTLEWVENIGENNKGEAIFFSLAILNSGTLYKRSSQAKFKKYSNLGVGFNIDVRY